MQECCASSLSESRPDKGGTLNASIEFRANKTINEIAQICELLRKYRFTILKFLLYLFWGYPNAPVIYFGTEAGDGCP
ncbi:MAG: hypothetical protein JWL77_2156 [Chthonomonadaceae bacterium]|nr:hypothetical protein [Chthonomonadaceae bacterium]